VTNFSFLLTGCCTIASSNQFPQVSLSQVLVHKPKPGIEMEASNLNLFQEVYSFVACLSVSLAFIHSAFTQFRISSSLLLTKEGPFKDVGWRIFTR
jgi:hypothetical protein